MREELQETHAEAKEHLDNLFQFMAPYSYELTNKIYLPEDVSEQLAWFDTPAAERLAGLKISGIEQLFGFAKALVQGCGFVVSDGKLVRYVGYSPTGDISPGTVLLDATADVDGVSRIVSNQVAVEVPQARYDNLQIIYVPQHTTKHLNKYFKTATNQRAYVRSMVETIEEHMVSGERGLAVCKKTLFDQQRVPNWPDDDERFKEPESYTKNYEWDIEGRKLCAVHWGTGIGSNDWKDAEAIFLMDEFHLPRRIAAAHVQGLRGHRVHEGDLSTMTTINSKTPATEIYLMGHRLRWIKQMALRGRARCYDEHGVCGRMRLVVSCELESFVANVGKLFPGAKVRITGVGEGAKWADKVIAILNGSTAPVVTPSELTKLLRKEWRTISRDVLKSPEFLAALDGMGWRYVASKGRGGSRFERIEANEAVAA